MVGSNLAELQNAVDKPEAASYTEQALLADMTRQYADRAGAIVAAYRREYPGLPAYELRCVISTAGVRDASFALTDSKFAVDGKAWQYLFTWRTPMLGGTPGCFHCAEIAFVFNNADLCDQQTGGGLEALRLAERMSDAWIAFARHGQPGHAGLPAWPAFDKTHPTMVFDNACRLARDPEAAGRALLAAARGA
jgi:para-nitrobenzyl esterase